MSKETVDKSNENKKAYELAFHLVPTLGDDKVNKVFEEITNLIEKNKGKIVSSSQPALLDLEYQMEKVVDSVKLKFNSAYFGWIIFTDVEVADLSEELDLNKNILRYLLIKTDQKDSIQSIDVANILNESKRESRSFDEEKVEEVEENIEAPSKEVVEKETVEETEEAKQVDEAIDELVK
jgi:ribosomal protein S6